MPGLVYTFERDPAVACPTATPLSDVMNAITVAAADAEGIRFHFLTDEGNPSPMVVVVFSDILALEGFRSRLDQVIPNWGIRVRELLTARNA